MDLLATHRLIIQRAKFHYRSCHEHRTESNRIKGLKGSLHIDALSSDAPDWDTFGTNPTNQKLSHVDRLTGCWLPCCLCSTSLGDLPNHAISYQAINNCSTNLTSSRQSIRFGTAV